MVNPTAVTWLDKVKWDANGLVPVIAQEASTNDVLMFAWMNREALAKTIETNRAVAASYWHWYFLQQPAPFPERLIEADPDYFYETCLFDWGAAKAGDFDPEILAEYRRCWRDPAMIHGSCADYRAAATIDLEHDAADLERQVECPTLILYGAKGQMAKLFDLPAQWSKRCANRVEASLPGGHFFVDQFPEQTARILAEFLSAGAAASSGRSATS